MKISEELIDAFVSARNGVPGESSWILAVALQQAVAENLEMKHKLLIYEGHRPFTKDWLAEADKLLRGEK